MIKAVLFDLDNTLVLYNEPAFLQQYFSKLSTVFADLMPAGILPERILLSTMALSSNDGFLTNADYFMNTFLDPGADRREVWNRFLIFYQTGYRELLPACRPPDGFDDVFSNLRSTDTKLVLATNPIYPLAAYEHRLSWIGLAPSDFSHITHIENAGFVKPNPGYFRQICETIQVDPQSCLMVGNDSVYDIAASAVRIRTYLTTEAPETDYLLPGIPNDGRLAHAPDYTGPFSDISEILTHFA